MSLTERDQNHKIAVGVDRLGQCAVRSASNVNSYAHQSHRDRNVQSFFS